MNQEQFVRWSMERFKAAHELVEKIEKLTKQVERLMTNDGELYVADKCTQIVSPYQQIFSSLFEIDNDLKLAIVNELRKQIDVCKALLKSEFGVE